MKSIQLQHVKKRHGDTEAVREVDVIVEAGECFSIVGPSSSGKSALLRMIAGLDEPTSGTIRIDGVAVDRLKRCDRRFPMLTQRETLHRFLTVEQNLMWALRRQNMTRVERRERCHHVLAHFGMSDLMKRRPHELSGGERQCVVLARLLMVDSPIYLLDEPFSHLDVTFKRQLRTKLRQWQKQSGFTLLHVTQDQSEAMMLADRMMVMTDGLVQQIGKPIDVYNKPANTFVASFIGTPAMNLTPVTRTDKGWAARDGRLFQPLSMPRTEGAMLGIRPEHIVPAGEDVTFYAELNKIELLGTETLLSFQVGDTAWTAKWTGQWPLALREKVACYVAPRHMMLFDETGHRLEGRPQKLFELYDSVRY